MKSQLSQQQLLVQLAHTKMPFGKYKDWYLIDLPEYYLVWCQNKSFAIGALGNQLQLVYELKLNGLEHIIHTIKRQFPNP